MVGLLVDVKWDVVDDFLVGFICDLKAILVEDLAEVFLVNFNLMK